MTDKISFLIVMFQMADNLGVLPVKFADKVSSGRGLEEEVCILKNQMSTNWLTNGR